jgi:hypothetical protein
MERTDKYWGVPAKFRQSDLGTWDALLDVGEADSAGNVTEGLVEIDHVRNSYVRLDGPLTAVIGIEEVVVVTMNDAVLVGHRDNLPRLKDVVIGQRRDVRGYYWRAEKHRLHDGQAEAFINRREQQGTRSTDQGHELMAWHILQSSHLSFATHHVAVDTEMGETLGVDLLLIAEVLPAAPAGQDQRPLGAGRGVGVNQAGDIFLGLDTCNMTPRVSAQFLLGVRCRRKLSTGQPSARSGRIGETRR